MERGARVQLHRATSNRVGPRRVIASVAAALALVAGSILAAIVGSAPAALAQPSEWEISADGLGPITIGSTIDTVRAGLPDGYEMGDEVQIAPDLDGHVVSLDGAAQVLVPGTGESIETIIVLGDTYLTDDGIGPGSLVSDAVAVYGAPTLRFSVDDQGRERVEFADGPDGLSFRTSESVGPQAGIYDADATTTSEYEPDSRLTSVWIGDPDPAGAEAQPEPEPTDEPEPTAEPAAVAEPTAEPEPTDEPEPTAEPEDTDPLPMTGGESATIAAAALVLLFLGFGLTRAGNRHKPWS